METSDISWNDLAHFASSTNPLERIGAVSAASARVEATLKRLGYYQLLLPDGSKPTLLPIVRIVARGLPGSVAASIEAAVQARNRMVHEGALLPNECRNAVLAMQAFLAQLLLVLQPEGRNQPRSSTSGAEIVSWLLGNPELSDAISKVAGEMAAKAQKSADAAARSRRAIKKTYYG